MRWHAGMHGCTSMRDMAQLLPSCQHIHNRRAPLNLVGHERISPDPQSSASSSFHNCTSSAFSFACFTSTLWDLTAAGALVTAAVAPHACPTSYAWTLAAAFCTYVTFLFVSTGVFQNGFVLKHLRHALSMRMIAPVATPIILAHSMHALASRWCCWGGDSARARMKYMHEMHAMGADPRSDDVLQHMQQGVLAKFQNHNSGSVGGDTGMLAQPNVHYGGCPSGSTSAPFSSHVCPRVLHSDAAIWQQIGLTHVDHSLSSGSTLHRVSRAVANMGHAHHGNLHELHALAKSSPQPMRSGSAATAETARVADTKSQWHQRGFCVAHSQSRCTFLPYSTVHLKSVVTKAEDEFNNCLLA